MPSIGQLALAAALALCSLGAAWGQDLAPRAYVITPVHSNAIILTCSYDTGNVQFGGAVPITGAVAHVSVPVFTYYHSFSFFGRSANFTASLPYGVGNFRGTVTGAEAQAYRSGMLDSNFRFSVNLRGAPAMPPQDFVKWRQKMLLGASLRLVAPSGQYDPTKLVNLGNNRWAFKPEIGYSQRWGHWLVDAYAAAWFFTTNPEFFSHNQFFPGTQSQSEDPVATIEGHLSYDFKPRLWVSLDANYWHGGETSLSGKANPLTIQKNSRVGATASIPITKHQSVKVSYDNGAYISYGGNYQTISVAWQFSWVGRPN